MTDAIPRHRTTRIIGADNANVAPTHVPEDMKRWASKQVSPQYGNSVRSLAAERPELLS
jgi:hypothetical protein